MDGLLTGGKYTGWEDRFYTFSWIFAGVAMVLFFLFLLVAEGFIFLYPRKVWTPHQTDIKSSLIILHRVERFLNHGDTR